MCQKCDNKLLQLDGQVPHFLDWLHGGRGSQQADAEKAREAFREYQEFRRGVHG